MSDSVIEFDFSNKMLFNEVYMPILKDQSRYIILYGGRDSAKSYFAAQMVLLKTLAARNSRIILLRKYFRDIMDSQYQTILDIISDYKLSSYFKLTRSPLEINCILNGNKILTRGLDKPENTKSIRDPTGIWYEEADEIGYDEFINSSLSLRTSKKTMLQEILTFNPSKEQSWINNYFFPEKQEYERSDGYFNYVDSPRNDTTILHTTYRDNRFCSADRSALLESLQYKDMNYYKVYALGLWGGALSGLIFPDWHSVSEIPEGDRFYGLDTGYNNPSALVEVTLYDEKIYARLLIYKTKLTPSTLAENINEQYGAEIGNSPIYVDSADPGAIDELTKAGFNALSAEKGPDSVYSGIMKMKKYELYVDENSTELKDELSSYIWQKTSDGAASDRPVKFNDHAIDALRYAVVSHQNSRDKSINIKGIYDMSTKKSTKIMNDKLFKKSSHRLINY